MRYFVIQTLLFLMLLAAAVSSLGPSLLTRSRALTIAGIVIAGAAMVLAALAFVALGKAFRVAPQPRGGNALVTRGVYRWLRHPMYTAVCAISLGIFLVRPTVLVALAVAVQCLFLVAKSRYEERLLCHEFPSYDNYRKRSWGVIPLLRR